MFPTLNCACTALLYSGKFLDDPFKSLRWLQGNSPKIHKPEQLCRVILQLYHRFPSSSQYHRGLYSFDNLRVPAQQVGGSYECLRYRSLLHCIVSSRVKFYNSLKMFIRFIPLIELLVDFCNLIMGTLRGIFL